MKYELCAIIIFCPCPQQLVVMVHMNHHQHDMKNMLNYNRGHIIIICTSTVNGADQGTFPSVPKSGCLGNGVFLIRSKCLFNLAHALDKMSLSHFHMITDNWHIGSTWNIINEWDAYFGRMNIRPCAVFQNIILVIIITCPKWLALIAYNGSTHQTQPTFCHDAVLFGWGNDRIMFRI